MSEEKFNTIKQIINKNKDLGATINNRRYTLINANHLVIKIAKKRLARITPLNRLVEKAKQISELRSTLPR